MQAAQQLIDSLLGIGLQSHELETRHVVVRAIAVYVVVLVFVRLGKRRFMSGASAFDVILAIMLGAVASRAITGAAPFWTTLAGTAALMAMHWLFSWASYHSTLFGSLVKGAPVVILRDGVADENAMRRVHISEHDLQAGLRDCGLRNADEADEVRLERSGKLSVIKKPG
jgi:uncharacterized membrane protein YcaP (DUF421 family)